MQEWQQMTEEFLRGMTAGRVWAWWRRYRNLHILLPDSYKHGHIMLYHAHMQKNSQHNYADRFLLMIW